MAKCNQLTSLPFKGLTKSQNVPMVVVAAMYSAIGRKRIGGTL